MTEDELERAAEEIADEAVAGYEQLLPPEVIAEMRHLIVDELLCTGEGRARLRRSLPDAVVTKSTDVDAPGAEMMPVVGAPRKAGSGVS